MISTYPVEMIKRLEYRIKELEDQVDYLENILSQERSDRAYEVAISYETRDSGDNSWY